MALKNPFSQGTAETIDSDSDFIELVGPAILKQVDWNKAFSKSLTYWAGAQGGGKSTILRLFTPNVLRSIATREATDAIRMAMEEIGATQAGQPLVLGVHSKGTVSYRYIADMPIEESRQKSLFFALLNSRVIQRFIHAITAIEQLDSKETRRFTFDFQATIEGLPQDIPRSGSADELQAWAVAVERRCLQAIESASTQDFGHHAFTAQRICDTRYWKRDDKPLSYLTILMIDDGQEMTKPQRTWLTEACTREREGAKTWLAVRLHVLESPALFHGANAGREFEIIRLEELWVDHHPQHVDFVRDVISKRLRQGSARGIKNISELLQEFCSFPGSNELVTELTAKTRERAINANRDISYKNWLTWPEQAADPWDRMLRWRELEIYIARDVNSSRLQLREPLAISVLEGKRETSLQLSSLALLAEETKTRPAKNRLPLYFGIETLIYIGLHNVQLVINACERLYDLALDKELRRKPVTSLNAREQDEDLRQFAESKWNSLLDEYSQGRTMQDLLSCFVQRMRIELSKPNVPYAPSPVGLGIPEEEFLLLASGQMEGGGKTLEEILELCLAYNFLISAPRKHKSQPYRIFFVSPLVLMHFGLPIRSRQFQPTTLAQLEKWLVEGFDFTPARGRSQANRVRVQRLPSARGSARIDAFLEDEP